MSETLPESSPRPDPVSSLRGRLGWALKRGDSAAAAALRSELKVYRVAHQIEVLLAGVELNQRQRDYLAALFKPSIAAVAGGEDDD